MVISAELRAEIEALRADAPDPRAALLPALHRVAVERGAPGVAAMRELAELFEVPPAEVLELVSRAPALRGRERVSICIGLACALRGARALSNALRPGDRTELPRIESVECIGACDRAPLMLVDGVEHGGVDADAARSLLIEPTERAT